MGLILDTATDLLQMDMKVNFNSKQKGVWVNPDADLEDEVDTLTLDKITKRILWRVAQDQCHPLGLLSPTVIKFKMLMRNMTQESGKMTGLDECPS
jgi:hypothetical protein